MVVLAWGGFEWQQGDLRSGRHCCPFDWHAELSVRERRRARAGKRWRMVRSKRSKQRDCEESIARDSNPLIQDDPCILKLFWRMLTCRPLRCADVPAYDSILDSPIHGLSFRPILMVVGALMLKQWIVQNDFFRSESFEIVAPKRYRKLGVLPVSSVSRANRWAGSLPIDWLYFQSKQVKRLVCIFFLVLLFRMTLFGKNRFGRSTVST